MSAESVLENAVADADDRLWAVYVLIFGCRGGTVCTGYTVAHLVHG